MASLIRKENLKRDAEAQALEDVASIVFLEHYAADFAAKHDPEKVVSILAKTLNKMSDHGATPRSRRPAAAGACSDAGACARRRRAAAAGRAP